MSQPKPLNGWCYDEMRTTSVGCINEETGNHWYTFGHVKLYILLRNSSKDVKESVEYKGLKFRQEDGAQDEYLLVIFIWIVFKGIAIGKLAYLRRGYSCKKEHEPVLRFSTASSLGNGGKFSEEDQEGAARETKETREFVKSEAK